MDLAEKAMRCAVEMEVEAAMSSSAVSKGRVIFLYLTAAYEAGAKGEPLEIGKYATHMERQQCRM